MAEASILSISLREILNGKEFKHVYLLALIAMKGRSSEFIHYSCYKTTNIPNGNGMMVE